MKEAAGKNNTDFTLITSYIDNECNDDEIIYVRNQIEINSEFRLLFYFEKNFVINFRKHCKNCRPNNIIREKLLNLIEIETIRRLNLISNN